MTTPDVQRDLDYAREAIRRMRACAEFADPPELVRALLDMLAAALEDAAGKLLSEVGLEHNLEMAWDDYSSVTNRMAAARGVTRHDDACAAIHRLAQGLREMEGVQDA